MHVAIVPARLASSRLPNKPLADVAGKPLIVRVLERVADAGFDRLVAAVDDKQVQQTVTAAGFEAVMTSPDHASGSDRVCEVVDLLKLPADAVVVNVQGDEPLVPPSVLQNLLRRMEDEDHQFATLSEPIMDVADFLNPNVVKVVCDENDCALYFSRAPIPFPRDLELEKLSADDLTKINAQRHVGIYAFRTGALRRFVGLASGQTAQHLEFIEKLEQLRWLEAGNSIAVFVSDEPIPGGVDTAEDLARVRAWFG